MTGQYILKGQTPEPTDDFIEWAKRMQSGNRRVAETLVGEIRISTVFLGLDHSFGKGPPLLFETIIFGGELDLDITRYTTWDEAENGHKDAVSRVRKAER